MVLAPQAWSMAMVEADGNSEWNGSTSASSQSELASDKADSASRLRSDAFPLAFASVGFRSRVTQLEAQESMSCLPNLNGCMVGKSGSP